MDQMSSGQRKAAAVVLVLLFVAQQISAGPVSIVGLSRHPESSVQSPDLSPDLGLVQTHPSQQSLRRKARMTPLWRILNSKPFGAYCQNNYECSTGLCSGGFCATVQNTAANFVTD